MTEGREPQLEQVASIDRKLNNKGKNTILMTQYV